MLESRSSYDVVYCRLALFDSVGLRLSRALSLPLLLEINAPLGQEQVLKGSPIWLKGTLERRLNSSLRAAGAIFVVSLALEKWLVAKGVPRERIVVNPNGVNHLKFDARLCGGAFRRRHGIPEGAVVVGFVGSFHPWQGVDVLIDAFRLTLESEADRDVRLLLVGPIDNDPRLKDRLGYELDPKKVCATGRLPHVELPEALAACDICVAPFLDFDGFYFSPLKLFEFMAMGKAIVASSVGQIADVLADGESAVLVKPGSVPALSGALTELVHSPRKRARLGRDALEKSRFHTWELNARRVVDVARNLAGPGGRGD